jgi:hypothetical protein
MIAASTIIFQARNATSKFLWFWRSAMKCSIKTLVAALATILLGASIASADSMPVNSELFPDSAGLHIAPSMGFATTVPSAYFKVFGEWPQTWSEIVDEGLFQVDLETIDGSVIDPDDGDWDFPGDIAYVYQGASTPPIIKILSIGDGMSIMSHPAVDPGTTYELYLNGYDEYETLANSVPQLKLLALRQLLRGSLRSFVLVHGSLPSSWEEFLQSGLTPIDSASTNPVTGEHFFGDGRGNDFSFSINGDKFELEVTDQSGSTNWRFGI